MFIVQHQRKLSLQIVCLTLSFITAFGAFLPLRTRAATPIKMVRAAAPPPIVNLNARGGRTAVRTLTTDETKRVQLKEAFKELPLSFESNRGQAAGDVKFLARGRGYNFFLTATETVLAWDENQEIDRRRMATSANGINGFTNSNPPAKAKTSKKVSTGALRMKFIGANSDAKVEGLEQREGATNYFIGNDESKWQTDVPTFAKVRYRDVYPGVDVIFYGAAKRLEYDLVVAPNADVRAVKLSFDGLGKVKLDKRGELVLRQHGREVRLPKPFVYQETANGRRQIACRYVLQGRNQIGFAVEAYDKDKPLTIDPVILYSTYLGGSGDEFPVYVGTDAAGNIYVIGNTNSGDYPTTNGTLQTTFAGGGRNSFVSKLNPSGSSLIYSTYLGGNGDNPAFGGKVDSQGNVYVVGPTTASNFPVKNAFQATKAGFYDAFLAKINPAGNALLYSTYFGGNNFENPRDIGIDDNGNAWMGLMTNSDDMPVKNAFQATRKGGLDAFVARFDTTKAGADSLIFGTYFGGSGDEYGQGLSVSGAIAVDPAGNSYITSFTTSRDLPTKNPFQSTYAGGPSDTMVAKFDANGALVYSTYLGGNGDDFSFGVAVDAAGNAYIGGATTSTNFPTKNPLQAANAGGNDAYITKLDPTGSRLVYSTYLGGSGDESTQRIYIDAQNQVYVGGNTNSRNFPLKNPVQAAFGGGNADGWVSQINSTGTALVFSSYLGGTGSEFTATVVPGGDGSFFVGGITSSTDFPTMNPLQQVNRGGSDGFVTKIGEPSTNFALTDVTPNKGGDNGTVTARIFGSALQTGARIKLTRAGQEIVGTPPNVGSFGLVATTMFDLRGKPQGVYDVVVTNPNGATKTIAGGFTIETGKAFDIEDLDIDILGRDVIRGGREQTYTFLYSNNGNTDAIGVPVVVKFPKFLQYRLAFQRITPPKFSSAVPDIDRSQVPTGIEMGDQIAVPLILPGIPAGGTGTLPIALTLPDDPQFAHVEFEITADIGTPLVDSSVPPNATRAEIAQHLNTLSRGGSNPLNKPPADCIFSVLNLILDILGAKLRAETAAVAFLGQTILKAFGNTVSSSSAFSLQDIFISAGLGILALAGAAYPPLAVIAAVISAIMALMDAQQTLKDCDCFIPKPPKPKPPMKPRRPKKKKPMGVTSGDPNDKVGVIGVGDARYVRGDVPLPYIVYFENVETATAPAQVVTVTDQLDPAKVDLNTFAFGAINIGNRTINAPPRSSDFTTDVDLRPTQSLFARINAKLDKSTGVITWRFDSIDPATNQLTSDPLAGFLPPNKKSPEGDASLMFTVMPKKGIATDTVISNKARIVFDNNAAIDTPVWTNTIDSAKPSSRVQALASTSSYSFPVLWSGTDVGSGIGSYTIYVSEDGGAYTPFLTDTADTSGVFTGQPNKTYRFYSIARDAAGNQEASKTTPEATTTITVTPGNSIDDATFFVSQHYRDFLNREPDVSGFQFWVNQIASCNGNASCIDIKRQNVSAAYFLSIEFQQTGYLVYRFYQASFNRQPRFNELLPDTQAIGSGVIVTPDNSNGYIQLLESNKQAFANAFIARSAFTTQYPTSLTPAQFVDALNANTGNSLTPDQRNALVAGLTNNTETRATVLRKIAETDAFTRREFNRAFVLLQYIGYLRRNPDDAPDGNLDGYNFWLNKLNQFNGDYIKAEMVRSFILSSEYRKRFGTQ